MTEADTCRQYVLPKLYEAHWTDDQIREQVTFTDGRILVVGSTIRRLRQKRADYVLRFRRDYPIAVVEAKASSPASPRRRGRSSTRSSTSTRSTA